MGYNLTAIGQYYEGNQHGNYQFCSLEDIINQFMIVYVGEDKIIRKCNRVDVAFHAQRALAELSFDTFKSIKSQEITLPASLTMILPHDYVNYTKISTVDSSGIKHPLYPTKHTSNPFPILQTSDGSYDFQVPAATGFLTDNSFDSSTQAIPQATTPDNQWVAKGPYGDPVVDDILISGSLLKFVHGSKSFGANTGFNYPGSITSRIYMVYQRINVTGTTSIDLTATATSAAASAGIKGTGLVRIGVTSLVPGNANVVGQSFNMGIANPDITQIVNGYMGAAMADPAIFNLTDSNGNPSYLEFNDGTTSTLSTGSINTSLVPEDVDGNKYLYVLVISTVNNFTTVSDGDGNESTNTIDSVVVSGDLPVNYLQEEAESTTWTNFKANEPVENNINDYRDYENNVYWPNEGERYGLEPEHAQVNGSFYIDQLRGKIHFSSNISEKTVILDYISDSLGTESEMQVHKLAEEAMYRYILHSVASSYAYTQQLVPRLKKEKTAAIRQAKLRLSNYKLEELTQILRGKSKLIKH